MSSGMVMGGGLPMRSGVGRHFGEWWGAGYSYGYATMAMPNTWTPTPDRFPCPNNPHQP
jgi:hypothetical protein